MDEGRKRSQQPWYLAAAVGVALVIGVLLLPLILGERTYETITDLPLSLIAGALGLILLVWVLSRNGTRDRARTVPFAFLAASLALGGVLSLAPLANQAWSEPASVVTSLVAAVAAVWLAIQVFRPKRQGSG